MKYLNNPSRLCFYLMAGLICLCFFVPEVLATEEAGNWRSNYDAVMKWVNFGILVFIIVKFGRTPIMNFLRGRKAELAREFNQIENEKKEIADKIEKSLKNLEESEKHFAKLKEKIVSKGEDRKKAIIADARQQSEFMLETAKRRVESQIRNAKREFRAELVESAVALATERLPKEVTEEDNQRLIDNYLAAGKLAS